MVNNIIDAQSMKHAFLAGAKRLEANREWINDLNVFPVPDGDTGTNMSMTMMAAAKEVAVLETPTIANIAKAISSGSLRGARGNSGVILSQLFRGFAKVVEVETEITTQILADAFMRAAETAYKAVMKPKEGTILTVARGMADKAQMLAPEVHNIIEFVTQVIAHGDNVLNQTPEMLPVLKQAGVVDSGGQGLMQILKGVLDGLSGKEIDFVMKAAPQATKISTGAITPADIKFGYCTEFIINLNNSYNEIEEMELKSYLASIGDSAVVVSDQDIVKIHVHTNDPGLAIQRALNLGSLSRIKIDNMREEHEETLLKEIQASDNGVDYSVPQKEYGFITVAVGAGIAEIFRGLGADFVIVGGQTMNPSTEDMLTAIEQVSAHTIYIFPNNKNIILAAQQAKSLIVDKEIIVIPSKTIPQGIAAMINFIPGIDSDKNYEVMVEEMNKVKTGQITYAVRNTTIDDVEISEGDIIGIGDQGILSVSQETAKTLMLSVKAMVEPDSELITIYYGQDVKQEEAQKLADEIVINYPDCEVELHFGGQPIYYYLISVE